MATPKNARTRKSRIHPVLLVLLVLIGGVALLGTLALLGVELPFARRVAAAGVDHTGQVAVPIAARAIPAYTQVRRDHLINAETMEFAVVWLDKERAEKSGLITDASRILNRVLAHDKEAAYAFSEDDFAPEGTRAGPTAGIEPGMRGMRVPAGRIQGMHGLKRGDRFDLIAYKKLEDDTPRDRSTIIRADVQASRSLRNAWDATTRPLVQNGKVVEPVVTRTEPGAQRKQVEEVLIAVDEREVAGLAEALAVGADIQCLPRSGLPGCGLEDLPEAPEPRRPKTIEVIAGDERWLTVVPDDVLPSPSMEGPPSDVPAEEPASAPAESVPMRAAPAAPATQTPTAARGEPARDALPGRPTHAPEVR
jgi:Flp pilus assembly protein CpaB